MMTKRNKALLRGASAILVLLGVGLHTDVITIQHVAAYDFWFCVLGYGLLMLATR